MLRVKMIGVSKNSRQHMRKGGNTAGNERHRMEASADGLWTTVKGQHLKRNPYFSRGAEGLQEWAQEEREGVTCTGRVGC